MVRQEYNVIFGIHVRIDNDKIDAILSDAKIRHGQERQVILYTVDSRYLEFQGTLWNTSRYPYLDISDLQNWGKNNLNNHI